MKKISFALLLGLFIMLGNTVYAQASATVVEKIDNDANAAILSIKEEKSLKDAEKEKYILRIETFANAAKKNEDAKAIEIFKAEYDRIAESYNRTTGKELPKLTNDK